MSRLERVSKDYGMEISGEKTKLMTNNNNDMTMDAQIAGNTLDEVQSFKYLGAIISEEVYKPEVLARIAQSTALLSSLKIVYRNRNVTLRSKIRLMRYLAISIFLYAEHTEHLTKEEVRNWIKV